MIERLGGLTEPVGDLRYLPNKLHGDEIVAADGESYEEHGSHEWLDSYEVDDVLDADPTCPLVLVDRSEPMPRVYRISGKSERVWRAELRKLYISPDGDPDPDLGYALVAYRWQGSKGQPMLVFSVQCPVLGDVSL